MQKIKSSKLKSLLLVTLIYLIVILLSTYFIELLPKNWHLLLKIFVTDVFATLLIFACSFLLNNSSVYDPYWSVYPFVMALYLILDAHFISSRMLIVFVLVFLYALRLTSNWMRDWKGLNHQDWRYVELQQNNGKLYWLVSLAGIHLFPTILTFLGSISIFVVMNENTNIPLNWLDGIAVAITLFSIILCFVADEQMRSFRKTNPLGSVMTKGTWAFSRHPNYVGETLFWWGLWLFSLNYDIGWWFWCLVGPMAIYLLFEFISVPYMEERSIKRRKNYNELTKGIPKYFPWR